MSDTKQVVENNLKLFLESEENLSDVFKTLETNKIRYGIFAGACVSFLTSNREPTDVDILVADEDFDKLTQLLKGDRTKKVTRSATSELFYPAQNKRLEFVSYVDFTQNGKIFPIRLTDLAWKNVVRYNINGVEIIFLNPVDTLLEKAIAPRGVELGKHDVEDIEALMRKIEIDKVYLNKRAKEMMAVTQVKKVLDKYKILE